METRNVTLSLPVSLLRDAKVLAAEHHTSLSALLTAALTERVQRERGYNAAWKRTSERMRRGYDLGIEGRITISRDELHERR